MIFKISRTSIRWDKPCEEAFKHEVPCWHVCANYSEEEYNKRFAERDGGLWREKGTNHQITKEGDIKRQEGMEKCWGIKIDSLDHLIKFSEKYGELIFDGSESEIEIYDDYRE